MTDPYPARADPAPAPADPYSAAAAAAARLAQLTGCAAHDAAVVLGSGWLPAADALGQADAQVPLAELGGFAEPTVAGHIPVARSLRVGSLRVLVFLGRTHLYEGYPVATVVHGVRMAVAAGCRVIVLTNASGGIRDDLRPGQPVLISDQLNLTAQSPLSGPPPPAGYQARFTDLSDLYAARLRAVARRADPSLAQGVYAALPGPHYETPAEIRMLRACGADLVGMSTALEAIAARHLGAEVLGVSMVTNIAAGLSDQPLDHAEVLATGQASAARMGELLAEILPGLG
ncbi:MAG TPA: purine-nucleoside phosphorylase [Streptosporangiaceae bacterium]|nr:purine-nucleoside phosphorylase [Streptosporangiaceae bacterium]